MNLEEPEPEVVDPKVKQFSVSHPVKIGGKVRYTVTGVDSEGPFEDARRFS